MSLAYLRGGIPAHVNRTTAIATAETWTWDGGVANHLWFKNTGAGPIVLSFTSADSSAGVGITLAAGAIWEGPVEIAAFYTKSAASQTFEAVVFRRRG